MGGDLIKVENDVLSAIAFPDSCIGQNEGFQDIVHYLGTLTSPGVLQRRHNDTCSGGGICRTSVLALYR